jgi:hypothetical protein
LNSHRGSEELTFSKDLPSAEGEYFNGHGRYNYRTIQLTRKVDMARDITKRLAELKNRRQGLDSQ